VRERQWLGGRAYWVTADREECVGLVKQGTDDRTRWEAPLRRVAIGRMKVEADGTGARAGDLLAKERSRELMINKDNVRNTMRAHRTYDGRVSGKDEFGARNSCNIADADVAKARNGRKRCMRSFGGECSKAAGGEVCSRP
jgi:hypothetical protein